MLKKIKRDICIIKYRNLPLLYYDKKNDTDIYYYPEFKSFYWIRLKNNSSKKVVFELIKLIRNLKIDHLIFLNVYNKPWISKFTSERKDYKLLIKALEYFKSYKIGKRFNGGVLINTQNLKRFFIHFYTLTQCDGGFCDYYFMDEKQTVLFYLHYSGEIKVLTLNENMDKAFIRMVNKTKFIDSFRDNTDRI